MKIKYHNLMSLLLVISTLGVLQSAAQDQKKSKLKKLSSIVEVVLLGRTDLEKTGSVFLEEHAVSQYFPSNVGERRVVFLNSADIRDRMAEDTFRYFTIVDFNVGRTTASVSINELSRSKTTGGSAEYKYTYSCRLRADKWTCALGWKTVSITHS